jgi:hypothetical protein
MSRGAAIARSARPLLFAVALVGACATATRAQPLTNNDFRVDLTQGLVLGSGRAVGLGGAMTAVAAGIEGVGWNPAGYAHRERFQLARIDWSAAFSAMFPGTFSRDDFFNNGLGRHHGVDIGASRYLNLGIGFLIGGVGVGVLAESQRYVLETETSDSIAVRFTTVHAGGGYALFGGDVVIGVGARVAAFTVRSSAAERDVVSLFGIGAEAGVQLRFEGRPWAMGFAARSPVKSSISLRGDASPDTISGFLLPSEVVLPWELQGGFAFQLGPRPFNRRYRPRADPGAIARLELRRERCERLRAQAIAEQASPREGVRAELPPEWDGRSCLGGLPEPHDPEFWAREARFRRGERYMMPQRIAMVRERLDLERRRRLEALPRRYALISADVILYGRVPNAIGVDAFLDQARRRRGEHASVGYRLGIEGEPWTNRMKLRTGLYVEPGRNHDVNPRAHYTFGWDVRLFRVEPFGPDEPWDFRIGSNLDVARDYFDIGVGIGFWH